MVVAEIATTSPHGAMKGKTQNNITRVYNLDVIISVGYRVKSKRGTQFRIKYKIKFTTQFMDKLQ